MANFVGPDETAGNGSSNVVLHCLQRYMGWSAGLKELKQQSQMQQTIFFIFFIFHKKNEY